MSQIDTTPISNVVGPGPTPGSTTDNAVVRWDGTTGTIIQNSGSTLSDANVFSTGELNLSTALAIEYGGTGVTSNTPYAVLCGGTAAGAPIQDVADLGLVGQVFTSNGPGVLPSFQAGGSGSGDVTAVANLADNSLIRGDGGAKGIQDSSATLTDAGLLTTGELNLTTDLAILHGGSGRSTAVPYSVICGGTVATGPHQSVASVGAAGNVLTSNGAGALPTFQAGGSGDVTAAAILTDHSIIRGDGGAKGVQDSGILIDDSDNLSAVASVDISLGGDLQINSASVLNATTLGAGVTASSLTSVGTIGTGVWNGTVVTVPYGGTGASSLTDGGIMLGSGVGAVTVTAQPTNGQLLIGSTGVDPVLGTLTSSDSTITFTTGAGTLSIQGAAATDSQAGVIELATDAETNTGTATDRALTPANITAWTGGTNLVTVGTITTGTWQGTTVALDQGGTGSTAFTAGSVVFSNGSALTQDNSNLFWDDTNNRLGIGTTTPLDTLYVVGNMDLVHTAAENDDHALEIDCDAAGFGDVKAVDIVYTTGAVAATENEEAILINIDETASTGGEVIGLQVLTTTEGSAAAISMKCGPGIDAVRQEVGTFGNMDSALNKAVDVLAALSSGGAGNISVFVADNDTVTIGDAASFGAMEIIVDTGASGSGIAPTFEYSTGVGTWSIFSPADGTNGFRNTGVIEWDVADLAGFAIGTGSEYLIRITRTRNSLSTTPIVDTVQIAALTEYKWDLNADLTIKSVDIDASSAYSVAGTAILSDAAGTMTLSNVDALDATTTQTVEDAMIQLDNLTTAGALVTVGALNSGSITSGFGSIDNGASAITTTGVITGGTVEATTDTAAADNAAMGYTATEGLILTGQGSVTDVTIKNDADTTVISIPTGTTTVTLAGAVTASSGTITGPSGTWDSGGIDIAASDSYAVAGTAILSDSAGTMTLSNIDAIDATTEATLKNDFLANDGDTGTGVYDFGGATSFEIPNSATPTVNADGEIAVDITVTDWSHGILKYYSGEEVGVVAMPIAQFTSPTDNHVVTYNATTDEFELQAGGGGDMPEVVVGGLAASHQVNTTTAFAPVSYRDFGSIEMLVRSFDDTGPEYMQGTFRVPADLGAGASNVTFEIVGSAATAAASKNVKFTFDFVEVADDGLLTGAYGSAEVWDDQSISATQDDQDIISNTETITNLGWTAGNMIYYRLYRSAATTTNLSGDYDVISFNIRIPQA